jgi:hypothetical protein
MSALAVCQWIQDTPASSALRGSTWAYPILGAAHVLGIAWFGGAVLVENLRAWRRIGLAAMLTTGALLFYLEPVKCCQSVSFALKMTLLVSIGVLRYTRIPARAAAWLSLALWAGVVFAGRGIAFY